MYCYGLCSDVLQYTAMFQYGVDLIYVLRPRSARFRNTKLLVMVESKAIPVNQPPTDANATISSSEADLI